MKTIVEQHNVRQRRKVTVKDARLVPVIGRHCRSSLQRLELSFRDYLPAAILVSHSRFAPGYVVDSFLAAIYKEATLIAIAQAHDDPLAFMNEVVRSIGFDSAELSLEDLDHVLGLFLKYQKMHRRRTVLVVRDIDAFGQEVRARIGKLIEREAANEFGLMVILTGPASDSPEPMDPALEAILEQRGVRIVLTPFALSETREFVRDRFLRPEANGNGASAARPDFDFYAIGLIHELSSGLPETVDLLCQKSVEIAARDGEAAVSTTTVKAAARLLGLMPSTPVAEPEPPVGEPEPPVGEPEPPVLTPEAADEPDGQLIIRVEGEPEKSVRLNGSNLLVGRDRLCDICVEDVQVSRLHGLFVRAADGLHYVDLGSTNGSAVNGETTRRIVLGNKDVVAVGDVRIIYSDRTGSEAASADLDATDTFRIADEEEVSSINYVGKGVLHRDDP